jgi:hypothetical protein
MIGTVLEALRGFFTKLLTLTIIGAILILLEMWAAGKWSMTSNITAANAAVALGVISGAAVGIERLLEVVWTVVEYFSPGWPDASRMKGKQTQTSDDFLGFINQLQQQITGVQQSANAIQKNIPNGQRLLTNLQTNVNNLMTISPDDPNLLTLTLRSCGLPGRRRSCDQG